MSWISERRYNRDHRPYLETRLPDAVTLETGERFQPDLMLIWCRKHECWFGECPKDASRLRRLTTSELTSILVALAFMAIVFSVVLTQGTQP